MMITMTRGLNGESVLNVRDKTVGYVSGESYGFKQKLRVTVSIRMERLDRQPEYETTDHRKVSEPLDFSITTAVWRPRAHGWVSGGATVEPLRHLIEYADGFDAETVQALADLDQYHLNSLTAGCDHQEPVWRDGRYGREIDLDSTPACPATGYRYGHSWLVRELPEGFEAKVRELVRA